MSILPDQIILIVFAVLNVYVWLSNYYKWLTWDKRQSELHAQTMRHIPQPNPISALRIFITGVVAIWFCHAVYVLAVLAEQPL